MNDAFSVCRMDLSPYHHAEFREWEKQRLESIPGLRYTDQIDCEQKNILLTNTHTKFDQFSIAELESIAMIIHANSGYDNIPVEFARTPDFDIVVGNPIRAQAVATYVLTQLLNHYNPSPHGESWQDGRQWDRKPMDSLQVLLLGFGHIGKIVFESLSPLVREIAVVDPFLEIEVQDLQKRLAEFDVIIPLMSLNPTSRGIVSKQFLNSLKHDFVLVNGARGDLVDQQALIAVLRNHPQAYAYLDVFTREPFDQQDFAGLENIKLSSHVAGVFSGIDQSILDFEEAILCDYVEESADSFSTKYSGLILRNRIYKDFLI